MPQDPPRAALSTADPRRLGGPSEGLHQARLLSRNDRLTGRPSLFIDRGLRGIRVKPLRAHAWTLAAVAWAWLGLVTAAKAATLDARLSVDAVAAGQPVVLTLVSDAPLPAAPELSPLAQSFRILGQRRAETVSTVNGRHQARHELVLTLVPRRTGALTVPPLAIGDMVSPALALTVAAATNPQAQLLPAPARARQPPAEPATQEIRATAEISPRRAVLGQELVLTVRASSADGAPVGRLLRPRAAGASMLPLGSRRAQGAEGRHLFEQRYALFPQRIGRLQVTELGFDAWRPAGGAPVRHRVEPLGVTVTAPPPETDASTWLPARRVTLTEAGPSAVRIAPGQGIERMLTLRAEGRMAEDLPTIPVEIPFQLRVRDDPPRLWNERTPDGVVGYRAERILISAAEPGRFVLPGPSIDWWDTAASTMRRAALPDWTLTVASFASADRRPAARWGRDQGQVEPPEEETRDPAGADPAAAGGRGPAIARSSGWPMALAVAIGLPALALLAWRALRARSRRRHPPQEPTAPLPMPQQEAASAHAAVEALIAAVRDGYAAVDAHAARAALLAWAAWRWPEAPPRNLSQLVLRVEPPLRDDLKLLDAAFYGPGHGDWAARPVPDRLAALRAGAASGAAREAAQAEADRDETAPS